MREGRYVALRNDDAQHVVLYRTAMALYRISDRHPNYRDIYFQGKDIKGIPVCTASGQEVGSVYDLLIDDEDRIHQLAVSVGSKRVLIPANRCSKPDQANCVYLRGIEKDELLTFSPYEPYGPCEPHREEISTTGKTTTGKVTDEALPIQASHPPIQLYEERLVTSKQRIKTGEVKISKRTVSELSSTQIPITREKIIIEIDSIYGGETSVNFGDAKVAEDGAVHMDIYEEQAEVCRRIVPYQNISVRKEIVEDVVAIEQTIRREELDVEATAPYVEI
jgi:uncharacterized protein (TIGR02271 family)